MDEIGKLKDRVKSLEGKMRGLENRQRSNDDWIHEGGKELVRLIEMHDGIIYTKKVQAQGPNSLRLPIPKEVADELGIQRGDLVEICIHRVLRPDDKKTLAAELDGVRREIIELRLQDLAEKETAEGPEEEGD